MDGVWGSWGSLAWGSIDYWQMDVEGGGVIWFSGIDNGWVSYVSMASYKPPGTYILCVSVGYKTKWHEIRRRTFNEKGED